LGTISAAHAQYRQPPPPGYGPPPGYYPPPPPAAPRGMYREGLVLGLGLGAGALAAGEGCLDFCGGALALYGDIGAMINPRMGIVFDAWLNDHPVPNTDSSALNGIYSGALKLFLNDFFWLQGGVGFARYSDPFGDDSGFAIMGAGGIEILQANNFALDL